MCCLEKIVGNLNLLKITEILPLLIVGFLFLPSSVFALSYYESQLLDDGGLVVPNAQITVYPVEAPSSLASLFQDSDGISPLANPVLSDSNGFFEFYTESGSYHLKISTGSESYTLLDVAIVNPMESHHISAAPTIAPLTLIESGNILSGNNSLAFERLDSTGLRVKGPWRINTNKGSSGIQEEFLLTYNTDWDEPSSSWSLRDFSDMALYWRFGPTTEVPMNPVDPNHPFFDFNIAPTGPAGTPPDFGSPGLSMILATDLWGLSQTAMKLGWGPFVIGNGLENSSFLTRRVSFKVYNTSGPMGVLVKTDNQWDHIGTDLSMKIPGEVAVMIPGTIGYGFGGGATRTTTAEEEFPSVFIRWGHGTPASLVNAGKALVRIRTDVNGSPINVQRGNTLVSADASHCPVEFIDVWDGTSFVPTTVTIGCADVNNLMTDSRKILGYAIENSGDTKEGYVAIITPNR